MHIIYLPTNDNMKEKDRFVAEAIVKQMYMRLDYRCEMSYFKKINSFHELIVTIHVIIISFGMFHQWRFYGKC